MEGHLTKNIQVIFILRLIMHGSQTQPLILNLNYPRCTVSFDDGIYRYRLSSNDGKIIINVKVIDELTFIRKAEPINITVPPGIDYVLDLSDCFAYCMDLEDISELASIDSTKIIKLNNTFSWCHKLYDLTALANWDVSNVTDMFGIFYCCSSLTTLQPLELWNPPDSCNIRLFYSNTGYYGNMSNDAIKPVIYELFWSSISIPEWLKRRNHWY